MYFCMADFDERLNFYYMNNEKDIISLASLYSVTETMNRLEELLKQQGITIYARIDQRAEARRAGLTLAPLELLIFGNPKGGIPLMNENPLCGLDLPLKVLVWEDKKQNTLLSYNSFTYLKTRYNLPDDLITKISTVESLIRQAVR